MSGGALNYLCVEVGSALVAKRDDLIKCKHHLKDQMCKEVEKYEQQGCTE